MSRSGEVSLFLGPEERSFRLAIGQWRQVQERCDAGPPELLARMAAPFEALRRGVKSADIMASGLLGRWRVDDIRAPILFGLIGGGSTPADAAKIVSEWVDERPLMEALPVAYQVVLASITGTEDEQAAGELKGETGEPLSPVESSGSDETASTPRAARSGSRRAKSMTSPSGS